MRKPGEFAENSEKMTDLKFAISLLKSTGQFNQFVHPANFWAIDLT